MKQKIFYFGNALFEKDNIVIKIIPFLKKTFSQINFVFWDPNENFPKERNLILLDVIWGPKNTTVIKDIDQIEQSPRYTAHDLDLGLYLKLYKKLGKIKKITIIGVPFQLSEKKAQKEVSQTIKEVIRLSKN